MLLARDALPEDASASTELAVSFPTLIDNSAESCPKTLAEIIKYVRAESADTERAEAGRLRFVRTALIGKYKYWLWIYVEEDATKCFLLFRLCENGSTYLSLVSSNGLSPEQYLLADYYDEIYWS